MRCAGSTANKGGRCGRNGRVDTRRLKCDECAIGNCPARAVEHGLHGLGPHEVGMSFRLGHHPSNLPSDRCPAAQTSRCTPSGSVPGAVSSRASIYTGMRRYRALSPPRCSNPRHQRHGFGPPRLLRGPVAPNPSVTHSLPISPPNRGDMQGSAAFPSSCSQNDAFIGHCNFWHFKRVTKVTSF